MVLDVEGEAAAIWYGQNVAMNKMLMRGVGWRGGYHFCRTLTFGCVFSANAGCARAAEPIPQ